MLDSVSLCEKTHSMVIVRLRLEEAGDLESSFYGDVEEDPTSGSVTASESCQEIASY